ncbi:hypothetical protein [Saccharicrinis aurantiacus]|uniref:hypothetical protein n=1 Tax=Saccharicrinis aurantiacus TaxID=1849719 RepID=UPI0015C55C3F|nr:hypothetical protein [Saccharicrinis aurantiacus]
MILAAIGLSLMVYGIFITPNDNFIIYGLIVTPISGVIIAIINRRIYKHRLKRSHYGAQ